MATKKIEIPFGAFDSELKGWEYTIPEGMEAEIKDGKIIVREKESEDERIQKAIIKHFKVGTDYITFSGFSKEQIMAWLDRKMFDHRGLIPNGLALEASEGKYKLKE